LEKLGEMYLKGEEVAADAEKARGYLERASAVRRRNTGVVFTETPAEAK
jgi:TPR repeat protein